MSTRTTKEEIQEIKNMLDSFNYKEDKAEIRAIFLMTNALLEKKGGHRGE